MGYATFTSPVSTGAALLRLRRTERQAVLHADREPPLPEPVLNHLADVPRRRDPELETLPWAERPVPHAHGLARLHVLEERDRALAPLRRRSGARARSR